MRLVNQKKLAHARIKNLKAQIWSFDFLVATTILVFVLLIFLLSWNDISLRWNSSERYRELKVTALYAADALVTTSGDPKSWQILNLTTQINQTNAIGLANSRCVLNNDKLVALKNYENSSYNAIKEKLGLSRYDMNILITDKYGNNTYYEFGQSVPAREISAVIERLVILNSSIEVLKLTVWSE